MLPARGHYVHSGKARFGSSRPLAVAVPGVPWACRVRGGQVSSRIWARHRVVWGRVPITAPRSDHRHHLARRCAFSEMRRPPKTGPTAKLSSAPMTTMWGAPLHRRWRGSRLRDPTSGQFLTPASPAAPTLRGTWCATWRLAGFKLANPHIITAAWCFSAGRGDPARPGTSATEIGRWVHIGDKNTIRPTRSFRCDFGDKVVLGQGQRHQHYLDIEVKGLGANDRWCYICDATTSIRCRSRPGHHQESGADRARHLDRREGEALRTIGRGCVLGSPSRRNSTIRSRSGRRQRWSRTASYSWGIGRAIFGLSHAALADIEQRRRPLSPEHLKADGAQRPASTSQVRGNWLPGADFW